MWLPAAIFLADFILVIMGWIGSVLATLFGVPAVNDLNGAPDLFMAKNLAEKEDC